MNKIELNSLDLKIFTELDASDYCQINNINLDDITYLNLGNNQLTDISGIKLFKNVQILSLGYNKITDISVLKYLKNLKILSLNENPLKDISVIKYLTKLEYLNINYLLLESDQIQYIKGLKKLKTLSCRRVFKDIEILNEFKIKEIFK